MLLVSVMLPLLVICQYLANIQSQEIYVPFINEGESEPPCAQGRNYCEHEDNYPRETIMKLLQRWNDVPQELKHVIFDDDVDEFDHESNGYEGNPEYCLHVNASVKSSVVPPLCEVMVHRIRPVVAKNHRNEWVYIVNDDGHRQTLSIGTCQNEFAICGKYNTATARCTQETKFVKLLALHPSGKSFENQNYYFDSCCKCKLYK